MYPFVAYANTVGHIDIMWSKEQTPYIAYYTIFYILVFSLIPHKEARFLVPVIPFLLLLTGEHVASNVKNYKWVYKISMWLYMIINIGIITFKFFFHQRVWEVSTYLVNKGEPIHSIYSMEHYMTAHYSWYHGFDTKLYPTATFPVFQRLSSGDPLALAGLSTCTGMIYEISKGNLLPQYIQIPWLEGDAFETDSCNQAILSLETDGHKLYLLEK